MSIKKKTTVKKTASNTKSKSVKTIKKSAGLEDLKSEILNEVSPILNKLSMPKIKKEVAKEFNSLLEVEFEKLKSEFDSKNKKSHISVKKIMMDLETKLIDSLKNNSSLKKQFDSLKKNMVGDLENNLEGLVSKKLTGVIDSTIALHRNTEKDIKILQDKFVSLTKEAKSEDANQSLQIREEERKQAQFIVDKVNEVVSMVNKFEDDFKLDQIKVHKNFEAEVESQFEEVEKKVRKELLHRFELELEANHQDYVRNEKINAIELMKFKGELSKHVKEYIKSLDSELKVLKNRNSELSLKEKDFMKKVKVQINGDVSVLEKKLKSFSVEVNELLKKLDSKKERKVLNDEIKSSLDKSKKNISDELAKQIILVNEEITRIGLHSKENVKNLTDSVEDKLFNEINTFKNSLDKELQGFNLQLKTRDEDLNKQIKQLSLDREGFASERTSFNDKVSNLVIESKNQIKENLTKFKEDGKTIKSNLSESIIKKFETQVDKFNKKYESNFEKFKVKVGKVEDKYSNSLAKINSEKEILTVQRVEFDEKFNLLLNTTQKKLDTIIDHFEDENKDVESALSNLVGKKLTDQVEEYTKIFNSYVEEFENKLSDEKNSLEESLKVISEQRDVVVSEWAEIKRDVQDILSSFKIEVEESIAKQVSITSDHINKVTAENIEFREGLKEQIENKLVFATKQFRDEYDNHLNKFNEELKGKEASFLNKLSVVESEKDEMLLELTEFKSEISNLTKSYIASLNEQLEKVVSEEKKFETEKELFIGELDDSTKTRKLELEDYANSLRNELKEILVVEKETFSDNESKFRESFTEKINNLSEFQKKKLESIEKKFVDRNLKYVTDRVEQSLDVLKIVENDIETKVETAKKQIEIISNKEDTLMADVAVFERNVNEKVEERIMNLEKSINRRTIEIEDGIKTENNKITSREEQFGEEFKHLRKETNEKLEERIMGLEQFINRRFLNIDEEFTNFKGIVIDEVEDLMKDVKELVSNKVGVVDKHIDKINFAGIEIVKRVKKFDNIKEHVEKQMSFVRDDVNDMRVKQDVLMSPNKSMSNIIGLMSDYEQNLLSLVDDLREKKISDIDILHILAQKGHPMFYVKMVLSCGDL